MRNIYLGTRRPREHEVNALFSASLLRAFHLHNFCFRRWRVWPLGRGRRLRCQLSILNLLKLYLFISLPCGKRNVYSSFRHDLGFSLFFFPFILSFFSSSFTRDSGCLLLLLLGQWKALVRKSAHGLLSEVLGARRK